MSSLLAEFILRHERIFVLTGAGVSTASGIPDYRDASGAWKHQPPMDYREFIEQPAARQKYWARSFIGWQRFRQAEPNPAHIALAQLESLGKLTRTVTQNVDGLHQRAGSTHVTELHGCIETVSCITCGQSMPRASLQDQLRSRNPALGDLATQPAPDGYAYLPNFDESVIAVPSCIACDGVLKPDVVFFGESVPAVRVSECFAALDQADAVLVAGSSLMVYSGFRFVRKAQQLEIPIVAINQGVTRADEFISLKLKQDCGIALTTALQQIAPHLAQ